MEYAYATCILNESNREINEENLTAVLEAAGCPVQSSRVKAIIAALEDVDVGEITTVNLGDVGAEPSPDLAAVENGNGARDHTERAEEPTTDADAAAELETNLEGQPDDETVESERETETTDDDEGRTLAASEDEESSRPDVEQES